MYTFLAIVTLCLLAAVLILARYAQRRRISEWQVFATRHGLHFRRDDSTIIARGIHHGRRLELQTLTRFSSDGDEIGISEVQMRIQLRDPPPQELVIVRRDGAFQALDDYLREDPISSGEAEFDEQAIVKCSTGAVSAQQYLFRSRIAVLSTFFRRCDADRCGILKGDLFVEARELMSDAERLERWLQLLEATAGELDSAQPNVIPLHQARAHAG